MDEDEAKEYDSQAMAAAIDEVIVSINLEKKMCNTYWEQKLLYHKVLVASQLRILQNWVSQSEDEQSVKNEMQEKLYTLCKNVLETLCSNSNSSVLITDFTICMNLEADFTSFLTELSVDSERYHNIEDAWVSYLKGEIYSTIALYPLDHRLLKLSLHSSIFYYNVLEARDMACSSAKKILEAALAELVTFDVEVLDSKQIESLLYMELLQFFVDKTSKSKENEETKEHISYGGTMYTLARKENKETKNHISDEKTIYTLPQKENEERKDHISNEETMYTLAQKFYAKAAEEVKKIRNFVMQVEKERSTKSEIINYFYNCKCEGLNGIRETRNPEKSCDKQKLKEYLQMILVESEEISLIFHLFRESTIEASSNVNFNYVSSEKEEGRDVLKVEGDDVSEKIVAEKGNEDFKEKKLSSNIEELEMIDYDEGVDETETVNYFTSEGESSGAADVTAIHTCSKSQQLSIDSKVEEINPKIEETDLKIVAKIEDCRVISGDTVLSKNSESAVIGLPITETSHTLHVFPDTSQNNKMEPNKETKLENVSDLEENENIAYLKLDVSSGSSTTKLNLNSMSSHSSEKSIEDATKETQNLSNSETNGVIHQVEAATSSASQLEELKEEETNTLLQLSRLEIGEEIGETLTSLHDLIRLERENETITNKIQIFLQFIWSKIPSFGRFIGWENGRRDSLIDFLVEIGECVTLIALILILVKEGPVWIGFYISKWIWRILRAQFLNHFGDERRSLGGWSQVSCWQIIKFIFGWRNLREGVIDCIFDLLEISGVSLLNMIFKTLKWGLVPLFKMVFGYLRKQARLTCCVTTAEIDNEVV